MADVIVQYSSSEDAEEAQQIASSIESLSSLSAEARNTDTINWSTVSGVIAVGGSSVNPVYETMANQFGWSQPMNIGITGLDYTMIASDIYQYKETMVQGLAGWSAEDTDLLVDYYTGDKSGDDFFSHAGVDDFIDEVREIQGDDTSGDPTEDPSGGGILDPDQGGSDGDTVAAPDMPVLVEVEGVKINFPDVEPYSFTVSGWVKEIDSVYDDLGTPQGIAYRDKTVEGKTGGGDRDKYRLSEDAEITDFEADGDKWVYINGNRYRYNSDRDAFEEDGVPLFQKTGGENDKISDEEKTSEMKEKEKQREENQNETVFDQFIDALTNPTDDVDNALTVVVVLLLLLVILRAAGITEEILSKL